MKKLISLFVLAALVVSVAFTLPSCGDGKKVSVDQIELNYWSMYPSADPLSVNHMKMIEDFEKNNPDIKIVHNGYNFFDYFTKLSTSQAGGTSIDIFWNVIDDVRHRAEGGISADIKPFIDEEGMDINDWPSAAIEAATYNGGIYALPAESDIRVLYYNKDMFAAAGIDQPPKTLEEMSDLAKRLTKETDDGRSYSQVGFHPMLGNNSIQTAIWGMGGSFFDEQGNPILNSEINIKAVEWWSNLNLYYDTRKFNVFNSSHKDPSGKDLSFIQGASAMVIDTNTLVSQLDADGKINYDVAPVPWDGDNRHAWADAFTMEISEKTTSQKKKAAFRFLKYMTDVEVQTQFLEKLQFFPANIKAQEKIKETANDKMQTVIEEFTYARYTDFCQEYPSWFTYYNGQIFQAAGGKQSAKQAADKTQAEVEKQIAAYKNTH